MGRKRRREEPNAATSDNLPPAPTGCGYLRRKLPEGVRAIVPRGRPGILQSGHKKEFPGTACDSTTESTTRKLAIQQDAEPIQVGFSSCWELH